MARHPKDITEAELALMQILWTRGKATIRQIADELYPAASPAQYATVQKQLDRLEAKAFVRRDRSMFVHVFEPATDRDDVIGRRIREVADKLCGGSLAPILSHLARARRLNDEERRALRALIDSNEEPPRNKPAAKRRRG